MTAKSARQATGPRAHPARGAPLALSPGRLPLPSSRASLSPGVTQRSRSGTPTRPSGAPTTASSTSSTVAPTTTSQPTEAQLVTQWWNSQGKGFIQIYGVDLIAIAQQVATGNVATVEEDCGHLYAQTWEETSTYPFHRCKLSGTASKTTSASGRRFAPLTRTLVMSSLTTTWTPRTRNSKTSSRPSTPWLASTHRGNSVTNRITGGVSRQLLSSRGGTRVREAAGGGWFRGPFGRRPTPERTPPPRPRQSSAPVSGPPAGHHWTQPGP